MPARLSPAPVRRAALTGALLALLVLVSACSDAPADVPRSSDRTSGERAQGAAATEAVEPTASASSQRDADTAAANVVQWPPTGKAGPREWQAAADDAAPWVQLTWPDPQRIASVQIFGPADPASDPKQSSASALYGTLRFSDGASIAVTGVDAGAALPTTIAFPARTTDSVRLELRRQIDGAIVGLRSFTAYTQGTTPPRPGAAQETPTYSATPPPATCDRPEPARPAGAGRLTLLCPGVGESVDDRAEIVVGATPGTVLVAELPNGAARARSTVGASGKASFSLDVSGVPQGPFAVAVRAEGEETDEPTYVQLFHAKGGSTAPGAGDSAPAGMTLQYDEQFDEAVSVTGDGRGAEYSAFKPEPWGGAQFGDSVFADPAWGAGTISTLPGGYLRLRAQPIDGFEERQTWGQQHISGLISSQRVGGTGFSAQYGYFEARILGAPGPGAWPAFWMMNTAQGVGRPRETVGEVDAVELYGHDTRNTCHSTHAWGKAKGSDGARACPNLPDGEDWATQWHTYGVQVLPESATFYVDGVQVATLPQLSNTDEPFFFMLDLATGGGWPVDLSATQETTEMYVDWVRVYT